MQTAVIAFLSLYVMMFGFKILLSGDIPSGADLFNFIIKIILVIYFSVGINISTGGGDKLNGMIEWVIPLMLNAVNEVAGWVLHASPSELCKFSNSEYPSYLSHLSLWDALDCRVSHYLGLDILTTMAVENLSRNHSFENFDFFNFAIPPYYYLLIPAFLIGSMTLVNLALMYPLLVLSVGAYLVNATVVCIIGIVILSVLAPLFVPMVLFNYTKGYFESWLKLMFSFVLQPMVVTTFMLTMFTVYDFGFYGQCKYTLATVNSDGRNAKIFYVDNDWSNYTPEEEKSCKNSLGYTLNNPVAAAYDFTQDAMTQALNLQEGSTTQSVLSKFGFLGAIIMSPGLLFTSPKLVFEKIKQFALALLIACFTLYLMYHFSEQLSGFAADMTEGVSLDSVSIKPTTIFKAGQKAMSVAGGAMKGVGGAARGGVKGGAEDKLATGSGEAEDKLSTGGEGGEAQDKISSGRTASPSGTASSWKKAEVSKDQTSTPAAELKATAAPAGPKIGAARAEKTTEVQEATSGQQWKTGTKDSKERTESQTAASERDIRLAAQRLENQGFISSTQANNKIEEFLKEKNIPPLSDQGKVYTKNLADTISRYTDRSTGFGKSEAMLKANIQDVIKNPEMKGHEKEFTNMVEEMFKKAAENSDSQNKAYSTQLANEATIVIGSIKAGIPEVKKETPKPLPKIPEGLPKNKAERKEGGEVKPAGPKPLPKPPAPKALSGNKNNNDLGGGKNES